MEENETPVDNHERSRNPVSVYRVKESRLLINRIILKLLYLLQLLLAFTLALFVTPVFLICFFPLYIFRYFVSKLSSVIRPDLGKIMSSRSTILGTDTIYNNPKCVIVSRVILQGKLDFENFQQNVQTKWIESKTPDGAVEYPELSQFISTFMGYLFWRWDDDFHIRNHVKLFQRKEFDSNSQNSVGVNARMNGHVSKEKSPPPTCDYETPESIDTAIVHLVKKSFDKRRSPWEIIVVEKYRDGVETEKSNAGKKESTDFKSVLLIRWHHSLMDGNSSYKLLTKITTLKLDMVPYSHSVTPSRSDTKETSVGTILRKFVKVLWFIFRAPYEALLAPVESLDLNPWHLRESQLNRNSYFFCTDPIPLKKIDEVRFNYQVTFSAMVYALITGAMRNFMIKSKPRDKIPKLIHAGLSFPFPGHPDKLRNHMSICTSKLPVGIEDPISRLYFVEDHLNQLKNSTVLPMSFHLVPFIGTLPLALLKGLVKNNNTTIMLSNMPGPREKIQFILGQQLVDWADWVYASGHGPGSVGISIFALTYNGVLKFCVVVDSALAINKSVAKELPEGIVNELTTLDNLFNSQV